MAGKLNQARISQILGSVGHAKCGCVIDKGVYTKLCAEHAEIRRQAICEAAEVAREHERQNNRGAEMLTEIAPGTAQVLRAKAATAREVAAAILRLLVDAPSGKEPKP